MSQDYNATLQLPQTEFPMRAGLPKREPEMLAVWEQEQQYALLMQKNAGKPTYMLHDGPPFSNNDIHLGTALNKILKDFVVRYKNMAGFRAPFVPGWDNHGMPIESAIAKQQKVDRKKMSVPDFRNACHDFAQGFVERHREQFKRLGVIGDWAHPYRTMDPSFEANEVRLFGRMAEKGYIYKGKKPVYWCAHDETALAEAEIEYQDQECQTIYVKFKLLDAPTQVTSMTGDAPVYVVIWTTTTWTLPGNVAISLHPELQYALVKVDGAVYVVADALKDTVAKSVGWDSIEVLGTVKGRSLDTLRTQHPFLPRESLIIVGEHVTAEAGTGCVHTAPGHGIEDYYACRGYDLPIIVPVDAKGRMTEEAGRSAGLTTTEAAKVIIEELVEKDALLASQTISHSYPHCWRCHHPVLYRATEQWFASVEAMKADALRAAEQVTWMPEWGRDRMMGMVRERADWCISRQRHWGLPIPAFYCNDCGKPIITPDSIEAVATLFAAEGSNAWYAKEAADILPAGFTCPHCQTGNAFTKDNNTLDGWFDSGSTHDAVLKHREGLSWPADLYLEGGDQYRGWFQSSLLTAMATDGTAPYRAVLTHGWVVDGEGRKMSKSLGNATMPEVIVNQYGADILRLWVASMDFRVDVRVSVEMFKQLSEAYLKLRNTARFLLGNLNGFDPNAPVAYDQLTELDRYALMRCNDLVAQVTAAYDAFEFHRIFHAIHNFCVVDMSNVYLDIVKDRVYCEKPDSIARRAAQTTMYRILDALTRMLTPILAFTADEIWRVMPHHTGVDGRAVLLNDMPAYDAALAFTPEAMTKWERIVALRGEVNKALEVARADKVIGKSLEAAVTLTCGADQFDFVNALAAEWMTICIVSAVEVQKGDNDGVTVTVSRAVGDKCVRCWCFTPEVGHVAAHPELCPRCAAVVS